mgnify:CR=1 FL=1
MVYIHKFICFYLILIIPFNSIAMTFEEAAELGKSTGHEAVDNYTTVDQNPDGSFEFTRQDGTAVTLAPDDLIQGLTGELAPAYSGARGSDANTNLSGTTEHSNLRTEETHYGDAYGILRDNFDGGINETPDLSQDPIMTRNREVLDPANIPEDFSDCSSESTWSESTTTEHIEELRHCTEVPVSSLRCEVSHSVLAEFIDIDESNGFVHVYRCDNNDPTCIRIRLGTPNYNVIGGGYCTVHEQFASFNILTPEAIESVTYLGANWDDIFEARIGNDSLYSWPAGIDWQDAGQDPRNVPYGRSSCETGDAHGSFPNIDVTAYWKNNPTVEISQRVGIGDAGFAASYWELRIDPTLIPIYESYYPQLCLDEVIKIDQMDPPSQVCSINMYCAQALNPINTCSAQSLFCPTTAELPDSPSSSIPKSCETFNLEVDCAFSNQGPPPCYTNALGEEVCPEAGGAPANHCKSYEDNPECAFVSRSCQLGGLSSSGECAVYEQTFDCGYDIDITQETEETTIECAGPVRCMGLECVDDTSTTSDSFGKATALFQSAQMIQEHGNCDPGTGVCEIFKGDRLECKQAITVGGHDMQDCCYDPVTPEDFGSILKATASVGVLDYVLFESAGYATIESGAAYLQKGASHAYTAATNYFTGSGECAGAFAETVAPDALSTALSSATQSIYAGVQTGLNALYTGLGDAVITESAAGVLGPSSAIGTLASGIMAAYAVYQLTNLAIQYIYACEEPEYELAAKRGMKACHYLGTYCYDDISDLEYAVLLAALGPVDINFALVDNCVESRQSYCCYSSPLARIIMEQVALQGIVPFGGPRSASCDGILIGELDNINWDPDTGGVDLTEWTLMLAEHEVSPKASEMTLDFLTGEGSTTDFFDNPNVKLNAVDRLESRSNGIDFEESVDSAEEGFKETVIW